MEAPERPVCRVRAAVRLKHVTSTLVWLSVAVEKSSLFRVGIVVFLGMSVVITPPSVSMPSDSGATRAAARPSVAREDPACHRRADGHDFVRIHAFVRLPAEELAHELLHLRHPRRAADEHYLVDPVRVDTASLKRRFTGAIVRSRRSSTSCSSFARDSFIWGGSASVRCDPP